VLMHTDVKVVPESASSGISVEGRTRKFGTTVENQGVVERSSLNHWPPTSSASLRRL
jgi:hypothetical protein